MQIPMNTSLTVRRVGDQSNMLYLSEVLGPNRYGMSLTVPRLYDKFYPVESGSEIVCLFVDKGRLWQFRTYVMGYDQTVPPRMVVAEPPGVEEANRRETLRFRIDLPVSYLVDSQHLSGEQTRTVDLSLGGLCMVTTKLLDRNSRLALSLDLGDMLLQGDGVVRWSAFKGRTPLAGVRFDGIRGQGAAVLYKYLVTLEREWGKVR